MTLFLNTNYSLIGANSLQLVKEAGLGYGLIRLIKPNVTIASITVRAGLGHGLVRLTKPNVTIASITVRAGLGYELVRLMKHNVRASITVRVSIRITTLSLFIRGVLGGGGDIIWTMHTH